MRYLWTDEMSDLLVACWNGGNSDESISRIMSNRFDKCFTRNQIIGKRHRLIGKALPTLNKMDGSEIEKPPASRKRSPPRRTTSAPALCVTVDEIPVPPPILREPLSLMELSEDDCRYPIQVEPEFRFCGLPIHHRSCCRDHFALCYETPVERRRRGEQEPLDEAVAA